MFEKFIVNIGRVILEQILRALFLEWQVFKKKQDIKKGIKQIENAKEVSERIRAINDLSRTHHDGGWM